MARSGGSRSRRSAPSRPVRSPRPAARPAPTLVTPEEPRTFTLAAVPGATPGTWIAKWRERFPAVELTLLPIAAAAPLAAFEEGADAAIVRLPVDDDALHLIPLYEEVTVAVVSADSHLTAAEELELADLAGEVVITPADDVLAARVPGAIAPSFTPPAETADAVETVAAGVGVVLVPMSIARMHARKDVATRPVRDAPVSRVALAWPREATTPDVEAFIGIVRGRTPNSSR
jgi:hypothetical protein